MGFATMDRGRSFVLNQKGVGAGGLQHQQQSEESESTGTKRVVCRYWLAGRCSRRPCPYLHSTPEHPMPPLHNTDASSYQQQGTPSNFVWLRGHGSSADADAAAPPPPPKLCRYWMDGGNCSAGDNCRFLHSWFTGDDFTMLAHLPGHHKAITGIALLPDSGNILAWGFNETTKCFDPSALLKGHDLGVLTLVVGSNMLYSGSMDSTVKLWDLDTLQCVQTLTEHTSAVMSLLCWEKFLFSSSLDGTVRVWAATDNQALKEVYTHTEEHGVLRLCVMLDSASKPVLLCSSNNNVVYLYDLPSFEQRAKIFSKEEVRVIQAGPEGIFLTGDGTGDLRVWKWSETTAA